jgi:hypothetical protein
VQKRINGPTKDNACKKSKSVSLPALPVSLPVLIAIGDLRITGFLTSLHAENRQPNSALTLIQNQQL